MLGVVAAVYKYKWKEAEQRFRSAMAHEPVPPRVHLLYGFFYLLSTGWTEKANEQRYPGAAIYTSLFIRSSPRWASLAKLMNLPEEVG